MLQMLKIQLGNKEMIRRRTKKLTKMCLCNSTWLVRSIPQPGLTRAHLSGSRQTLHQFPNSRLSLNPTIHAGIRETIINTV